MGHDDPHDPHHRHHHRHHDYHHGHRTHQACAERTGVHDREVAQHKHEHPSESVEPDAPSEHTHAHEHEHEVTGRMTAARKALTHGAGTGRILHFDCFSGLAGDMIVGALLDLGVPREPIDRALDALALKGYRISTVERVMHSIAATRFVVEVTQDQPYRTWREIRTLLESAPLGDGVKRRALDAFRWLATAEGKIHRIPVEEVHFHEVGAVDAIVDIVAASAALEWLGARVTCAPLPMGRGFARTEHGVIPLPAPAVVELLQGIPTIGVDLDAELVTPTGAAIVRANATEFPRWPAMRPVATGFGAGTRTLPDRPNLLRVVLGDSVDERTKSTEHNELVVLESNVDDATGEMLAHVVDMLLRAGALDAWTTPIGMKKGRPGVMLSALTHPSEAERLARVMLSESTTLGVRVRSCARIERPRRHVSVETPFGRVDVKVADGDGLPVTAKPEDEVVRAIAQEKGIPARTVYDAAVIAFWDRERREREETK